MSILGVFYERLLRKPAPKWLRRHGPLALLWKVVRKWLCVSVLPFVPFNSVRILGYRVIGFKIGHKVFIGMQCYLDDLHPTRMVIEDNVVVSYRVTFACHGPRTADNRLILREGCYIGTCATLLGGLSRGDIEVGPYATVGACALVTRSVPPLATVVGIPAKVVRTARQPWGSDDSRTEELCRKYLAQPVPRPQIEPHAGIFHAPVTVTMKCEGDDETRVHYTSDGAAPSEDAPLYRAPFTINRTTLLKARVFKAGHLPSDESTTTITIA